MRIRKAVPGDVPEMVELGRRFFQASGYADITEYDPQSFAATVTHVDAVFFVVEKDKLVGMAGALVYPFYFNLHHKTAQEMFWWVDPQYRGVGTSLFEALVEEVKKRGAQSLSMIALESLSPERVGAFYKKRGFRPSERSWIRRL